MTIKTRLVEHFRSSNTLLGNLFTFNNSSFYRNILPKDNIHNYFEMFKLGENYTGTFIYKFNKKPEDINTIIEINLSNDNRYNKLKLYEEIKFTKRNLEYYNLSWKTGIIFNRVSFHKIPCSVLELIRNKTDKDIITCSSNK